MFSVRRTYQLLFAAMLASMALVGASGCHLLLPDISHQPVVHNPFPQLSRVAIAPFFNQSDEPTVDGRDFALAYFAELQAVPGYEVVPLGVVEEAILEHQVDLSNAGDARRLAKILGVDAVAIGTVTDYTPYYPPRCGLRVEWYSANPGFHEIPAGYGLPWGTPEEEFIPKPLVFEAEMALAKAQLATQTPDCDLPPIEPPASKSPLPVPPQLFMSVPSATPAKDADDSHDAGDSEKEPAKTPDDDSDSETSDTIGTAYEEQFTEEELPTDASSDASLPSLQLDPAGVVDTTDATGAGGAPPGWPDQSSLNPQPPCATRPPCMPYNGPVMTHTRIYQGSDSEFTEALASYYHWRDDARFGGWQNYLQRSDDFIRFCCHMHISEMLSARGGAGETRVVWQWSDCR